MPPNDAQVVCYIGRHGRTSLNASNSFRGNANPPLDEVGIKQAHELADFFSSKQISHIFCSDKQRAVKTAEIIAQAKGNCPVHQSEQLRALDVGTFSGQPRNSKSEAALQQYLDSPDTKIPGGESLNEFKARIGPCFEAAIKMCMECGAPPLIVGHSSVVHEAGSLTRGDHKSVLVQPGGAIALFIKDGKVQAEPIFKPLKVSQGNKAKTIT
jgi:probable phosphoglycerate mutase